MLLEYSLFKRQFCSSDCQKDNNLLSFDASTNLILHQQKTACPINANSVQTNVQEDGKASLSKDISDVHKKDCSVSVSVRDKMSSMNDNSYAEIDSNKIIAEMGCWSIVDHQQFLKLYSFHGSDFEKIAHSMAKHNFSQVRAYAYCSFKGEVMTHWSIQEYENFLKHVPKVWFDVGGWNKASVVEIIQEKFDSKENGTETFEQSADDKIDNQSNIASLQNPIPSENPQENYGNIQVNKNDVVSFTRGSNRSFSEETFPGNVQYQKLLSSKKKEFLSYSSLQEQEKKNVLISIIESIESMDPPGHFFKFDARTGSLRRLKRDNIIQMSTIKIRKAKPLSAFTKTTNRSSAKVHTRKAAVVPLKNNFLRQLAPFNAPPQNDEKNKFLRQLAPFNAPPQNDEDAIANSIKRSRRQRHVVSFFEPDFNGQSYNDRKDVDSNGSDETQRRSPREKKRRREIHAGYDSSKRTRRSITTTRLSRSAKKDVEEKPPISTRRLSRKATRRLATNSLVGYLYRNQPNSEAGDRDGRR